MGAQPNTLSAKYLRKRDALAESESSSGTSFWDQENVRGTFSPKTPERKRGARHRQPDPGSGVGGVRGHLLKKRPSDSEGYALADY